MSPEINNQSSRERFIWFQANNNNPIISTFLWVLESYLNGRYRHGARFIGWIPSQQLMEESKQNNSNNKINDASEIKSLSTEKLKELKQNNGNTTSNNNDVTVSKANKALPERLCSSENDLAALGRSSSQRVTFATYQRHPHPSEPLNDFAEFDVSVSPAWGFYVAITPEQQEFYSNAATIANSKANATSLLNAKSSYRKSPKW